MDSSLPGDSIALNRRYLDRLKNDFHSEYTKLQVVLADGRQFADA